MPDDEDRGRLLFCWKSEGEGGGRKSSRMWMQMTLSDDPVLILYTVSDTQASLPAFKEL